MSSSGNLINHYVVDHETDWDLPYSLCKASSIFGFIFSVVSVFYLSCCHHCCRSRGVALGFGAVFAALGVAYCYGAYLYTRHLFDVTHAYRDVGWFCGWASALSFLLIGLGSIRAALTGQLDRPDWYKPPPEVPNDDDRMTNIAVVTDK